MKKRTRIPAINFAVTIDGAPVEVVANPYITANERQLFRVSYNGSPIHIFGYNEAARKIELVDSASEPIPLNVERAIGENYIK